MDFGSTAILDEILKFFQDASITGMLNLIPHAKALLLALATIDLCSTWALYDGEMKMSQMISKIMKLGAFLFIIMYWNDINHAIMVSFQYAGLTAANVPVNGDVIQPSKLLDNGFNACSTLFKGLSSVGLNIGKALMYVITIGLVLFSFFVMALQILITKIEFNIFASIAVILMPFGAIRYTNFLCQRCISAVFAFGVKLMVMFFLIGLVQTVVGKVDEMPKDAVTFSVMLKYAISYLVLGYLVWKVPNLAAMMMQGQPALDAPMQSIKNTTQQTARTAVNAATLPVRLTNAAASKGLQTFGNFRSTLNTARIRAHGGTLYNGNHEPFTTSGSGRSTMGEFGREIFRQKVGNYLSGNLEKGAQNALEHSKSYRNARSGAYSEEGYTPNMPSSSGGSYTGGGSYSGGGASTGSSYSAPSSGSAGSSGAPSAPSAPSGSKASGNSGSFSKFTNSGSRPSNPAPNSSSTPSGGQAPSSSGSSDFSGSSDSK